MELTYTGDWTPIESQATTLDIGDYTAHVYLPGGRSEWRWWAQWIMLADDPSESQYEEIGRHVAAGAASAKAAAEEAIRRHHAARFICLDQQSGTGRSRHGRGGSSTDGGIHASSMVSTSHIVPGLPFSAG